MNYLFKDSGNKPVILFLHGFMGNCRVFDRAIEILGDNYSYLTVDLPGHGKTKVLEEYDMSDVARSLVQLLDSLLIKKCFLVGYSLGGRLALYLALNFPQYFVKVILESASPGLKTARERNQRRDLDLGLATALTTSDFSLFLKRWYDNPLFLSLTKHPDFPQLLAARLDNNSLELANSLRYLGTGVQPSLWQELNKNRVPITLLAGELDKKFITINSQMCDSGELLNLRIIKGCGHNIHFENPLVFAKAIEEFFFN